MLAAGSVIAERGYADTRISDVAERAGVSGALVIYYFESRDRLLAEALIRSDDRFYEDAAARLAQVEGHLARLSLLVELTAGIQVPDPTADYADDWPLWLELWARARHDPSLAADRAALDRRWRAAIASIVQAGIDDRDFAPLDANAFAVEFAALLDGLAVQVVLGDESVDAAGMVRIALGFAARSLGF